MPLLALLRLISAFIFISSLREYFRPLEHRISGQCFLHVTFSSGHDTFRAVSSSLRGSSGHTNPQVQRPAAASHASINAAALCTDSIKPVIYPKEI